jgi:cyclase
MLKKRIIFTLLYKNRKFVMSRNFITNEIGDADWIVKNYNFSEVSKYIDELVILNLDKDKKSDDHFINDSKKISKKSFIPVVLGGNVKSLEIAKNYFTEIADKIMINSVIKKKPELIKKISEIYGKQSIIASIDFMKIKKNYYPKINHGKEILKIDLKTYIEYIEKLGFGEIYLNSIERDGTGQGCDLEVLNFIPKKCNTPIIISGGVGKSNHILNALKNKNVNAIATANLLNFVGDSLKNSRREVCKSLKDLVPR